MNMSASFRIQFLRKRFAKNRILMHLLIIFSGMLVGCEAGQGDSEPAWVASLKNGRAVSAELLVPLTKEGSVEGEGAEDVRRFLLSILDWSSTHDTTMLTDMPAGARMGHIIIELDTGSDNLERVGLSLFMDRHYVLLNNMAISTSAEDEAAIRDFMLDILENDHDGD